MTASDNPVIYQMLGKNVDDMDREELLRCVKILIRQAQAVADALAFSSEMRKPKNNS